MSEGPEETGAVRLNKALADAGVCSRRGADALIFAGRVRVNGAVADSPGLRVKEGDRILVDSKAVALRMQGHSGGEKGKKWTPCWLMLHKPVGVVSTARDPEGRRTVLDFVPPAWKGRRLFPVGRLDYFSEGLILLTDDGELAHRLSHPRWHLPRRYEVLVRPGEGASLSAALRRMERGMTLKEGERLAPVEAEQLPPRPDMGKGILLGLTLHQGLNRQIRRMCRDLGLTVLKLRRVSQGPLRLGSLRSGEIRPLEDAEIAALRQAVGL
ncbi:MAG TPA: rRNA pseudouridine synthase [Candidatus Mailhella merdavium]|nr:rRNA pseudouridine synthase [Candidatus Mailhella merdavium]